MVNDPDYRLYLDERFSGIGKLVNAQFKSLDDRLERIEQQTTKTNGRVSALEKALPQHEIECSAKKEVDVIQKDLEEYHMIKKYPKLIILLLVVLVGAALYNFFRSVQTKDSITTTIKTELQNQTGVSKVTRGGYVHYNDGGMSDSIKIR